jgi:protein involved in polysaccharide export with SLBB domain
MRALPIPSPIGIASGDVLEFKFFYNPELNETQTVDPDGKLSLQLIGKIDAAGKTLEQLAADLKQYYLPVLRNPEVVVIPRSLPSQRVFIGGQVVAPGPVDIQGEMTLLQAIMFAGGFRTETASLASVIVVRQSEGKQIGTAIDLRPVLKGKEADNFRIYPRDVIYVPQSHIAKVDQWVDQYLYKIVPTQFGLSYSFSDVKAHNTNDNETE